MVTTDGIQTTNSGFVVDDDQPYPIYGWITLRWVEFTTRLRNSKEHFAETIDKKLRSSQISKEEVERKLVR